VRGKGVGYHFDENEVLEMSNYLAKVSGDRIDGPGVPVASIRLDTPTWFSWLAEPTTRSFSYPVTDRARGYISGYVTVRKEHRPRGGDYVVGLSAWAGTGAEDLSGPNGARDPPPARGRRMCAHDN
jgi:hypothetical protein